MNDESLKNVTTDKTVLQFVNDNLVTLDDVDKIISFCEGVAKQTSSVDRFSAVDVSELASNVKGLYKQELNPLSRPVFIA